MLADPFAPQPLEYSYALADLHAHFLGASQKAGNAYAEQEAKGSAFGVPFTRAALHHALEQVKLTEVKIGEGFARAVTPEPISSLVSLTQMNDRGSVRFERKL